MRFRGVDEVEATVRRGAAASEALGPLFERPLPDNGTATSKAAAERARPAAETDRLAIFECLVLNPQGLTRLEIHERTGIKENTVNGRANDLVRAGMAVEHGVRDGRKVLFHALHAPQRQGAA
jgi:hypothetical protein